MITDELKRQFGELAVEFSENLERGAHANLEALADQWLALEVRVRTSRTARRRCRVEFLTRSGKGGGWGTRIRHKRPNPAEIRHFLQQHCSSFGAPLWSPTERPHASAEILRRSDLISVLGLSKRIRGPI
jgi:hypothetical protein